MQKLVIASNNDGKIREFKDLFGHKFDVMSMAEAGFDMDIAETGSTFEQNATIKANAIYDFTKCAVIADDSGLCCDALDGKPGVLSARYFSDHDNDVNIDAVLKDMADKKNRKAKFVCAICYIDTHKNKTVVMGECNGNIAYERRGTNGFGYDSIFVSDQLGCTFAEATLAQKQSVSHRAISINKLMNIIK